MVYRPSRAQPFPCEAIVKAKIRATLEGLSVKANIIKLVEADWLEMEKKGILLNEP